MKKNISLRVRKLATTKTDIELRKDLNSNTQILLLSYIIRVGKSTHFSATK